MSSTTGDRGVTVAVVITAVPEEEVDDANGQNDIAGFTIKVD